MALTVRWACWQVDKNDPLALQWSIVHQTRQAGQGAGLAGGLSDMVALWCNELHRSAGTGSRVRRVRMLVRVARQRYDGVADLVRVVPEVGLVAEEPDLAEEAVTGDLPGRDEASHAFPLVVAP